jgi:hypothetical protein
MTEASTDVPLAIGEERIPAQEHAAIAALGQLQARMQGQAPDRRGQHPKAHGCLQASFLVLPDVPEGLRHGLFAE